MSIDLNSCIGCGACVIACHAENNVSVVGKDEVLRYHDMHWIRIDRYYSPGKSLDNPDDVQVLFQPMLCQHCDNAPCENVCPVNATQHSSEGLNQMIYNRCIGTRYCANNCPFKVRRFNWADYTGADSFPNNQDQQLVGKLDPAVFQMQDDLTRMVLNPDVVVRSRGVMEKCPFCVQRLQDGKLKAKREDRTLKDMVDIQTSCQQACPTEAIVFGNAGDKDSKISTTRVANNQRVFYGLEDLHVLPNLNYLAKVRNTAGVWGPGDEIWKRTMPENRKRKTFIVTQRIIAKSSKYYGIIKYESQVRPALVEGQKDYHQVTEDIVRPIEANPSRLWWIGFLVSVACLIFGIFSVTSR